MEHAFTARLSEERIAAESRLMKKKISNGEKVMQCPRCGSSAVVKKCSIANVKKKFSCKECSPQFVENPERMRITDAEWPIIDRLLMEKCHVGKRDDAGASALWDSLSEDCKKNGYFSRTACPLTEKHFQQTDTGLSSKEAGKQVISRGLI